MLDFQEPHPAHKWLVDSFFRLNRRRQYLESGPRPIDYQDMLALADGVLRLEGRSRRLFFEVMEGTDDYVCSYLSKRHAGKLKEITDNANKPKPRGRR